MACRSPSKWSNRCPTSSATAAIWSSSLASISRMSGVVGRRRALISVSCIPLPNPVSRTSAPCSWARRATAKAILWGESTPVIRSLRPSRSTGGILPERPAKPDGRPNGQLNTGGSMGSGGLGRRRVGLFVLFVSAAVLAGAGAANAAGPDLWVPCVARTGSIPLGATEAGRVNLDARLQDITLHSQAMHADVHVDVLVLRGYAPSSGTRYPVLYLLHGATGCYRDWPAHGVEGLVGDTPMIVVMPDDGFNGSYSDWYGSEL